MKLQDHLEILASVSEVAGKEYAIEQVHLLVTFSSTINDVGYKMTKRSLAFLQSSI